MQKRRLFKTKFAISPIIATLLLILIAIASGVVLYAYVQGFISNSTTNPGGTINSLSIDFLSLQSGSNAKTPVTVYVRDLGPGTESFNGGLYLRGTSLSDILAIAAVLTATGQSPVITEIKIVAQSASTFVADLSWSSGGGSGCSVAVVFLGATSTVTCTAASGTLVAGTTSGSVTTASGISLSTTTAFTADTGVMSGTSLPAATTLVFGVPVTAGTFSIALNSVGSLALAPAVTSSGLTSNPLQSGSTYTVQVTGTDGASTSMSAKSS